MSFSISEEEINILITEEVKGLLESRADIPRVIAKYGQAAGDALKRALDNGGEEAGDIFLRKLDDASVTTSGAVRRMATDSIADASARRMARAGTDDALAAAGARTTARSADDVTASLRAAIPENPTSAMERLKNFAPDRVKAGIEKVRVGGKAALDRMKSLSPRQKTALWVAAGGTVTVAGGVYSYSGIGTETDQATAGGAIPTAGGAGKPAPSADSTGDAGWDRYIRVTGSKSWSTPEEAKAVHDAWQNFVKSQGMQEQAGEYTGDFESYKKWWLSQNNPQLSPKQTIDMLNKMTAKPAAKPAAEPERAPMDGTALKQLKNYKTKKAETEKVLKDYIDEIARLHSENENLKSKVGSGSKFTDVMPTPDGAETIQTVTPNRGPNRKAFNQRAQAMVTLAGSANKAKQDLAALEKYAANIPVMNQRRADELKESVISESVYNNWQKLIK